MKIALLTREFPPEVYGGAGVHVEHLAAELASLVDVGVYCFGKPRSSPLVAATYQPWELLAETSEGAALRVMSVDLAMAAGVAGADLVHSHTWYANLGGHLAKLLHGITHVATTHSLEPLRPWKREQLGGGYVLSQFCERTGLEGADAIVAVSHAMREDVLRVYPSLDPAKVSVIFNGVDANVYRPTASTTTLERLGVDSSRPMVLFVGRITRQKGVFHLLRAAPELDPGAQLVLCATAPDTPAIGEEMRARVIELQKERKDVIWVDEAVPREGVVELMSHASVFVCPSVYEPFGLVNVEAMACAAPVVATAVGGITEIVRDGETGYLVPLSDDPGAFARALAARINLLLEDPARARRFGEAGRHRVEHHFSWPSVARATADLYTKLLG
ncbi:MAG: glycogen synthase [Acidimicrobiales bacterium]